MLFSFGAPAATSTNSSSAESLLGNMDFGSLLAGISIPPAVPTATSNASSVLPPPAPQIIPSATSLSSLLKSDVIVSSGIFNDPEIRLRLLSYLPADSTGNLNGAESEIALLQDTTRSPQFQQAVDVLGEALLDPNNYETILRSFNLDSAPGLAKLVRVMVDCFYLQSD